MNSYPHMKAMKELGIITDISLFESYCNKHHLRLDYEFVNARDIDGEYEYIPINDSRLFICCKCDNYCVYGYKECNRCNQLICSYCYDKKYDNCFNVERMELDNEMKRDYIRDELMQDSNSYISILPKDILNIILQNI